MKRVRVTEIDEPEAVGRRLHETRAARGLSLRDLAFPGCSAPYISAIEHGRRVPSLQVLNVLAAKLGVTAEYLGTGRATSTSQQVTDAELALRLGEIDEAERQFKALRRETTGELQGRCLGGLGVIALQRGDLERGVKLLEQARDLDREAFIRGTSVVEALGRAYANRGEYESAIALFTDAQARALERGDRPQALKHAVLLANAYIDLGDAVHSSETIARALQDAEQLKDLRVRANVYWTQARLHTIEQRHDLAARFAERALETLRVHEDERAIAFGQQLLAYIELERGNPERALELLDDARPTMTRVAEVTEQAVFELERARALIALGRIDEGLALLGEIGPVLEDGPRVDGARYLVVIAELYEQAGEVNQALALSDVAIDRLEGHRSPFLVRALRLKSRALEQLGRTEEALSALRRALDAQDASTGVHQH